MAASHGLEGVWVDSCAGCMTAVAVVVVYIQMFTFRQGLLYCSTLSNKRVHVLLPKPQAKESHSSSLTLHIQNNKIVSRHRSLAPYLQVAAELKVAREERDGVLDELVAVQDKCSKAEEEMLQWRESARAALAVVSS